MKQVIEDGKVYTIYEMCPHIEPSQLELVKAEWHRKEKKERERDWKQTSRFGYWKK